MLVPSAATHTDTNTMKRVGTRRRTLRLSVRGLRSEAAQIVDDMPDVLGRHLPLEPHHLGVGTRAVDDHSENFPVGGSVNPLGVGKVRRVGVFRRERAVAFRVGIVAEGTVFLERGYPQ